MGHHRFAQLKENAQSQLREMKKRKSSRVDMSTPQRKVPKSVADSASSEKMHAPAKQDAPHACSQCSIPFGASDDGQRAFKGSTACRSCWANFLRGSGVSVCLDYTAGAKHCLVELNESTKSPLAPFCKACCDAHIADSETRTKMNCRIDPNATKASKLNDLLGHIAQ